MRNPQHMYKILVVDDDPGNVNFLRLAFRDYYLVLTAYDGARAIDCLEMDKHEDIALILTDEKMPGKTGREILKASLETHPNTIRWLITAYPEKKDSIYERNEIYIDRYIRKPIKDRIDELKEDVKEAIKLFELRQQNRSLLNALSRTDDEFHHLREIGSRFIPRHLIWKCEKYDPEKLRKEVKEVDVTVLYANIRNYMYLSEKIRSQELFELLNNYLEVMSEIIANKDGSIIQYTRDAILTVFGLNNGQENNPEEDARKALQCACRMKEAITRFNLVNGEKNNRIPEVHFGIGINSGKVAVGCLGSKYLLNYTVIGNVVSTAIWLQSRIEGSDEEIITGDETYRRAKKVIGSNYKKFPIEESIMEKKRINSIYLITGLIEGGQPVQYYKTTE